MDKYNIFPRVLFLLFKSFNVILSLLYSLLFNHDSYFHNRQIHFSFKFLLDLHFVYETYIFVFFIKRITKIKIKFITQNNYNYQVMI